MNRPHLLEWLPSRTVRRTGRARTSRPRWRFVRPYLEVLENRTVPAVFNVGAGGVTILIADINAANQAGVSNTLTGPATPERSVCAPGSLPLHFPTDHRSWRGDFL